MDRLRPINPPWGQQKRSLLLQLFPVAGVLFVAVFFIFMSIRGARSRNPSLLLQSSSCHFTSVYNFGDSNSDTGSVSAVFGRIPPPNGDTFFGKPSGRYSDGRLIIDFIAEKLGLPYLSAYVDSIGTNFQHGANFAASGSTIQPADAKMINCGFNPLTLDVQLQQFAQFKDRTSDLLHQAKSGLSRPEDTSQAMYMMDTGQNDLHAGITSMTEEQVKKYIPDIIDQFASAIKKLQEQGARAFWIHNTGPIGCLPYFVTRSTPAAGSVDQNGCVKSYNDLAQEFNQQLKNKVSQLRTQLQHPSLTYVDIYSVKYSLISEAKKHGFTDPLGFCCGKSYGDRHVGCGEKAIVNGTEVYGASCINPSAYISWDSIHYTEAANKWVANRILNGSFSDPPGIPITEACPNS